MAVITVSQKDLCSLGGTHSKDLEPILTQIGIPIEKQDGQTLHLEITPNRPDWLCVEGVARSIASYKTSNPKKYHARKSKFLVSIDKSTQKVRPFFGGAYISNVSLNQKILDSLIQLQEKLHDTLGRNRKKIAIGIHDAKNISSPLQYTTVSPDTHKFTPLGLNSPLTCKQILKQHPKGKKYSHLVQNKCPLIIDKNQEIISFPPIINSQLTEVTLNSKELFIDCTGTHKSTIYAAVNIICATLADHDASIHSIKINNCEYTLFSPQKTPLNLGATNKLLGTNLTLQDAKKHLSKMGHQLKGTSVLSPAHRNDILASVDLAEDIAISIGFNNFKPTLPELCTTGRKLNQDFIHQLCLGLGFFEVSSWILTNKKVIEKSKMDLNNCIHVQNPLTQEFTTMRPALYPNLLEIFSNSKSQSMPQNLYELGPTIISEKNSSLQKTTLCLTSAHPKSNFSQIHSHLKAFLDAQKISYSLLDANLDGFIPKRCAKIIIDSKEVGIIGEIHPQVLENFSIEQPTCLFELDLNSFFK